MATIQMETDTSTEEREVMFQRADEALAMGNRDSIKDVYDRLAEHAEMYGGDEVMPMIQDYLHKMNTALESTSNPT